MPQLGNPKHEQFCRNIARGMTVTEAHQAAGYKASRPNAYGLFRQTRIKQRLEELRQTELVVEQKANERAIERLALTKEALARELIPSVTGNMGDYITISENGTPNYDFRRVTRAQLSAIRSMKIEEFMDGRGEDARPVRRISLTLHDKVPSAGMVARLFNWLEQPGRPLPPRPIEEQLRAMTPEQRAADAAQLHERAIRRLLEADAEKKRQQREKARQEAQQKASGIGAVIEGEATEVPEGGK